MKSDAFFALVKNMRTWQKRYFRNRDNEALKRSKELEKQVDALIDATRNPSLFD
ncbi:hypothetical protein ACH3O9_11230 [Leeuwenhoekiella sp. A16]|uniref:hypothetical protein n=1 Tax=Leeuwenhoekiella sp. A16 TaxID=3141462 RepID=UPI003A8076D1